MDWTNWGTTIVGAGIAGTVGFAFGGPVGAAVGAGLAFGWSYLKGAAAAAAGGQGAADPGTPWWMYLLIVGVSAFVGVVIWNLF